MTRLRFALLGISKQSASFGPYRLLEFCLQIGSNPFLRVAGMRIDTNSYLLRNRIFHPIHSLYN